jgi:hypothetical protein
MTTVKRLGMLIAALITIGAVMELGQPSQGVPSLVSRAQAEVGRPLTPVSVAGVARRSARRN